MSSWQHYIDQAMFIHGVYYNSIPPVVEDYHIVWAEYYVTNTWDNTWEILEQYIFDWTSWVISWWWWWWGWTSLIIVDNIVANYTVDNDDIWKLLKVDTTLWDITITLPDSLTTEDWFNVRIRNVWNNNIIVNTTGTDTVEWANSATIFTWEYYWFTNSVADLDWCQYIKEVDAIIWDVSHFIGFYEDEQWNIFLDSAPVNSNEIIDTSKYNLQFDNWTILSPSWKIIDWPFNIENDLSEIWITLVTS